MNKLIFISLACLFSCEAQNTGANVVTLNVIPQQTIHTSTNFISAPLQNIGQSSHILKIIITTSTSSAPWQIVAAIQGSNDGNTWFNIGPTTQTPYIGTLSTQYITVTGNQTYAYIRTNASISLAVGLVANVQGTYTGNSSPAIIQTDASQSTTQMINQTGPDLTLPRTGSIISGTSGFTIVVYGLDFYLPSTATTLELKCSVTNTDIMLIDNLPSVWTHIHIPNGIRPYGSCSPSEGLTLNLGGTGTVDTTILYRLEQ